MGWGITLAVLALIAVCPLGVAVVYDKNGLLARALIGPVRITVFPTRKGKKQEKLPAEKPVPKKNVVSTEKTEKRGGSLADFLPLLQLGLEFLGVFRRKLRVKRLELLLIMAGDDPCDLAVNYGKAWAALGNLVPVLERFFVIKKRDLQVQCDFTADKTLIDAQLELTITLGRLLHLGLRYGIRVLREYFKIVKLRKGGAV